MNSRLLRKLDRHISEVGLGTWQIGGSWGAVDDTTALNILRTAYDNGVKFYDTADVYGDGRSERLIGRFLKEAKDPSLFVATKVGRWSTPGWPDNFSESSLRSHIQASLKRLNVDSLDLVQLHCIPTDMLLAGDVFDHLRQFKKEGLIKSFGASVETVEEGLICMEHDDLASLQIIFNIFRQKPIKMLFGRAVKTNTGIIVRLPLASGLLSGKMTKQTIFSQDDHRSFNRNGEAFNIGETFAGIPYEKGVELAEELHTYVPEGMTMAQMSLRWILDHSAVTTVIPGASSVDQVLANVSVSNMRSLDQRLHNELSSFYTDSVLKYIQGPY